jgi:hypothetical protein
MELQAALQLGHLNFSLATVAHIIRIHDKTGSGTISFDEFGKLHEFLTNVQQRWAGCTWLTAFTVLKAASLLPCMSAMTGWHLCDVVHQAARHVEAEHNQSPHILSLPAHTSIACSSLVNTHNISPASALPFCCCSFEFFDKDQTNTLNFDEIQQALQHAGQEACSTPCWTAVLGMQLP